MKEYGLIGYPLGHSASAAYFTEKFTTKGIDAQYTLYPIESIEQVENLRNRLSGFNVTIPYKRAIIPYLATVSAEAAAVGAVNCVKIDAEGRMHGYNTDVVGIRATLAPYDLRGQRAIVLGTGGAAAAVLHVLRELDMEITLVSRKATAEAISYEQLTEEVVARATLIVNATPVGMYPHTDASPQIPYGAIGQKHILFDLIYNPAKTLFLERGAQRGATVVGGGEMFTAQAEASWEIWSATDEF
ncbi:MAG: shikimate dehydrogenase [Alistipes sp.]|nr:shikimate dehydrogenase [Alistipes sp.]